MRVRNDLNCGVDVLPFRPKASWQLQYTQKAARARAAPRYKKSHFTKSCHSDAERSGGKKNLLSSKPSARRGISPNTLTHKKPNGSRMLPIS
jgi:hypothetical protein